MIPAGPQDGSSIGVKNCAAKGWDLPPVAETETSPIRAAEETRSHVREALEAGVKQRAEAADAHADQLHPWRERESGGAERQRGRVRRAGMPRETVAASSAWEWEGSTPHRGGRYGG